MLLTRLYVLVFIEHGTRRMHLRRADHVVIVEDQQGLVRGQIVDQRRDQPLERRWRGRAEQRGHPFADPGMGPVERGLRRKQPPVRGTLVSGAEAEDST